MKVKTSTPTRICLFGEHQDYLGLEVIAMAVNLRFSAVAETNNSDNIYLNIRDSSISELLQENVEQKYKEYTFDISVPLTYDNNRDYFKSAINVLKSAGYKINGCNIKMDSQIPIGKGMCSSTTMVIAYISAIAAANNIILRPKEAAELGWKAEVEEFNEPGGKMDHYASSLGGFTHIDFSDNNVSINTIETKSDGVFILIDSMQQKDTIKVLASSKYPTLEAIDMLKQYGINSIKDFYYDKSAIKYIDKLDLLHKQKLIANIDNYSIQREAYNMLRHSFDGEKLGYLLNRHHANLRDGLNVSTKTIDMLLDTAIKYGGYGGKVNGSGGGGCLFVYAEYDKSQNIMNSISSLGFPCAMLRADVGLTILEER